MKRLSTFLLALLLMSIGANAQVDYSSYLANGTWSSTSMCPSLSSAHESYNSSGNNSAGNILYCTVSNLPAGTYSVSFYVAANAANVSGVISGDNIAQAYVSVDGTVGSTQSITVGTVTNMANSWSSGTLCTLSATLSNAGSIEFGIQNVATGGNWYVCEGKSLVCTSETLTEGDVAHYCVAWDDEWSITGNSGGSFQRNVWSTEGETSGMVTPFIEYWVGGSGNLDDATISHTQITDLTAGYYTVSIDARAFNEGDETPVNSGTVLYYAKGDGNSQNVSVDLATGTSNLFNNYFEYYGTYSVIANVSTAGTLDVGFTISGTNSDWVSWKNLDVVYLGTTLSYSIGTPQCSLDGKYVQPGSEVSITFPNCVTPDETETPVLASGKSITVNSSAVDATLSYSGTTATVTFTMPEDIGYGATVSVTVPEGLLSWSGTSVSSAAAEFTLTTPPFGDQSGVYLYSTHADGFLSRGGEHTASENTESYGKIATTDPYGIPVDITFGNDGLATVKFLDSNLFLYAGGWAWTDGSEANAAKYLVEEVTTGDGETVYQFSYDGNADNYLYVNDEFWDWVANNGNFNGDNNLKNDITRTYWQIFTMAERDAYKAASILADHVAIAAANGATAVTTEEEFEAYLEGLTATDVTSKVADYALAGNLTGWTETDYYSDNTDNNTGVTTYFTTNTNGTEIYMGDARLLQTVSDLSKGIYKVTLQGFVRQGWADTIVDGLTDYDLSIGFLQANGYQINLKPWATEADLVNKTPSNTGNAFTDGRTYENELYTYVGDDGTLELSINCPDVLDGGWMMFKNLTLTYYGEDEYTNDVTWKLANPSFEVDNVVENLDVDTSADTGTARHNTDNKGAWIVESLTGWDLSIPTTVDACDLMTKDAAATDNNLGTPGEAADGTYMLYIKETWTGENTITDASVKQTVSLPAGDYKLTVDSKFHSGGATAKLVAGSEETAIAINGTASGAASTDAIFSSEDWTTNTVKFTVAQEGDVTVGVEITFTNNAPGSILLDNFKLYTATSEEEFTETISWEMTSAGWGTMILPFAATLADGLTAYSCDGTTTDEDTETTTVDLTEVGSSITANTPYIIKCTDDSAIKEHTFTGTPTNEKEIYTDGLLTGTLVNLAVAKGAAFATDGTQYLLQHHDGVDDSAAFYPIIKDASAEATLDAYHCYLTLDENSSPSGARVYIGFPDSGETTAIVAVEGAEAEGNGAIYDLSGRKVSKAVKGVYIQNGKKVLVK